MQQTHHPKVFISYSWDSEQHKNWILSLADRLCTDGIDVTLDQYILHSGKSFQNIIEKALDQSDKVIIIFTPNYKLKAENRQGGVGHEYSIITVELYNQQTSTTKFIPVLRSGTKEESIPLFLQTLLYSDFTNDGEFNEQYNALLHSIFELPPAIRPVIGITPKMVADRIMSKTETEFTSLSSTVNTSTIATSFSEIIDIPKIVRSVFGDINEQDLMPFANTTGKYGYKNVRTDKTILECRYDYAALFSNGMAKIALDGD